MAKNAYILRGLSGSGKSTLAKLLAEGRGNIHSTDGYFMENGVYKFDATKLGYNHAQNQKAFYNSCANGFEVVVCDNTCMARWEFEPYIKAAKEFGYNVHTILVGNPKDEQHQIECANRNSHGVSLDIIKRMANKFEP